MKGSIWLFYDIFLSSNTAQITLPDTEIPVDLTKELFWFSLEKYGKISTVSKNWK